MTNHDYRPDPRRAEWSSETPCYFGGCGQPVDAAVHDPERRGREALLCSLREQVGALPPYDIENDWLIDKHAVLALLSADSGVEP